jgi:RNA-directed DNA polymerase
MLRHLRRLALRAARGKRTRLEVARFLLDLDRSLDRLATALTRGSYQPGKGYAFQVRDPKHRLVYALPFPDRVVQHLLIDASLPALERWFAPQSYACRAGKGTHREHRACVAPGVPLPRE